MVSNKTWSTSASILQSLLKVPTLLVPMSCLTNRHTTWCPQNYIHNWLFTLEISPVICELKLQTDWRISFEIIWLHLPRSHSAPFSALSKSSLESLWKHNTPTGVVSPSNQVGKSVCMHGLRMCVSVWDFLCYVRAQHDKNTCLMLSHSDIKCCKSPVEKEPFKSKFPLSGFAVNQWPQNWPQFT